MIFTALEDKTKFAFARAYTIAFSQKSICYNIISMAKNGNNIKPEEFAIKILLPHYIMEELKDIAKFHDTTLIEEVTRAVLQYHAKCMTELIKGELK